MKNKILKLSKPTKLVSLAYYDKKIARSFHPLGYYKGLQSRYRNLALWEKLKSKLSTPHSKTVERVFKKFRALGAKKITASNAMIRRIFEKNALRMVKRQDPPVHSNLMNVVASLPMLLQAYTKMKKNKGALTLAASISPDKYRSLPKRKQDFLNKSFNMPRGISLDTFIETSILLKKGSYPWGTSRRIYISKPGQRNKLRPLTIPPFMDRVVQESVRNVLEAIYEPWFDKDNSSFGFRPAKGVHDAMTSIRSDHTQGMTIALEGDIQAAYDKVDKDILINILSKRIRDRKFLNMMRDRLNYTFFDTSTGEYETPLDGIPQGGIDSPYLFNIYLKEFDEWIVQYTQSVADEMNTSKARYSRTRGTSGLVQKGSYVSTKEYTSVRKKIQKLKPKIRLQNTIAKEKKLSDLEFIKKYELIREMRLLHHKKRHIQRMDPKRKFIRFHYVRYADDWIILSNCDSATMKIVKEKVGEWLKSNLKATLSDEKTLITNITKEPAHFLGFEVRARTTRKFAIKYVSNAHKKNIRTLSKVAGFKIFLEPDKQRLITRLHMKGYCTEKGFPREVPWLSTLDHFMIVERYNSVIRGFSNFYAEFVENRNKLNRWIYILRFSCLKTLAQKYKTTIQQIFKKYGKKDKDYIKKFGKTVEFRVRVKYTDEESYEKRWYLTTYLESLSKSVALQQATSYKSKFITLRNNNESLTLDGYLSLYNSCPKVNVKDYQYLDKITWINWRASASFNFPCAICGQFKLIEMHHIKAIRKSTFEFLKKEPTYMQVMGLRNRKQIPVCRECHMKALHAARYEGVAILKLVPDKLYDNNIVSYESKISKNPDYYTSKTLVEKGWARIRKRSN